MRVETTATFIRRRWTWQAGPHPRRHRGCGAPVVAVHGLVTSVYACVEHDARPIAAALLEQRARERAAA